MEQRLPAAVHVWRDGVAGMQGELMLHSPMSWAPKTGCQRLCCPQLRTASPALVAWLGVAEMSWLHSSSSGKGAATILTWSDTLDQAFMHVLSTACRLAGVKATSGCHTVPAMAQDWSGH